MCFVEEFRVERVGVGGHGVGRSDGTDGGEVGVCSLVALDSDGFDVRKDCKCLPDFSVEVIFVEHVDVDFVDSS